MSDIRFVYMTAGSMDQAKDIGKKLVERRLAACVNIIENMHSIYWWENTIQEDREVVLIAKTTGENLEMLITTVKQVHSYECPCIVALPVESGNAAFLDWIRKESRPR